MNKRYAINILILLIAGILVYANSFKGEFVMDDRHLIAENSYIKSFRNVGHIFGSEFFEKVDGFNVYRPMAAFLDMFDYSIWRLNPFGYHLTNFILHFIVASLVYAVLFNLFKHYTIALFLSLAYITHPSATEAIAYIPGRSDPLALIFMLSSFLLFAYFWRPGLQKRIYYVFSIIAFALACLSKETAAVFPVFLSLYIISCRDKMPGIKNKTLAVSPYFLAASAAMLLRYIVLTNAGNTFMNKAYAGLPLRIINAPVFTLKYICMFFRPAPFVFEQLPTYYISIFNPIVLASSAVVIAALVLIIKFYKSSAALGAAWFLIFIFPIIGIIPINAPLHYHWLYISSIGFLIIMADCFLNIRGILKNRYYNKLVVRYLPRIAGVVVLIFPSSVSIKQNLYFKDELTFYRGAIKQAPNSYRMHHNLGLVYLEKGLFKNAVIEFKTALKLSPKAVYPYVNLGYAYQSRNFNTAAERIFKKAAHISPGSYMPYYYLANLYGDGGMRRLPESIELYKKAIALKPRNPDIYYNLAVAYDKISTYEDSIKAYTKTIELNPAYTDAYINLGAAFAKTGRFDGARAAWEKGLWFEPDNLYIIQNLEKLKILQRHNKN